MDESNDLAAPERRVRDIDGDEWVERADGWCCFAPCDHLGASVHNHNCDEHRHFPLIRVDAMFGPLTEVA